MSKYKVDQSDDIGKAVNAFLNTGTVKAKFGQYEVSGQHLVYRAMVTESHDLRSVERVQRLIELVEAKRVVLIRPSLESLKNSLNDFDSVRVEVKALKQDVIASKLDNNGEPIILGNSSALSLIGRRANFGGVRTNRGETEIQKRLSTLIPMLPFTVFEQAKLDFRKIKIIDKGPEEKVTRRNPFPKKDKKGDIIPETEFETIHFTGASLFEIDGSQFLFDCDRRELQHKIFNPFLVKLPKHAETIVKAYEVLKPSEVADAEKKNRKIVRQGEWFFVEADDLTNARLSRLQVKPKRITLQAGPNRPNYAEGVQLYNGQPIEDQRGLRDFEEIRQARQVVSESEFYVTGTVSHAGREHADLKLKGWFKAIPNTATQSFTITGDID